jgi:hypothetical protein
LAVPPSLNKLSTTGARVPGFDADADLAYHLWIRGIADCDYRANDSVHVQFSDSVDAAGAARWRIGSGTST